MNIVLVTDAWTPQVNGVVTTLTMVVGELRAMDHEVTVIAPDNSFKTIPCPTYPEIRLAIWPLHQVGRVEKANSRHLSEWRVESRIGKNGHHR